MSLNAVLFDMDGTLVDSESMHFECWSQLLAPYNVSYNEVEFCQRFSGRPTLEAAIDIKNEHNLAVKNAIDAKVIEGNGASQRILQKIDMKNIDYLVNT